MCQLLCVLVVLAAYEGVPAGSWFSLPCCCSCRCHNTAGGALLLQALTPQLTENKRKTEELLREAFTLQQCLAQRSAAGILEKLLPKRYKQYQKGISSKV